MILFILYFGFHSLRDMFKFYSLLPFSKMHSDNTEMFLYNEMVHQVASGQRELGYGPNCDYCVTVLIALLHLSSECSQVLSTHTYSYGKKKSFFFL